ncbi:MAG TPA: DUF427 domain-containing protein [Woeseiaceae bacterium]|nr:DUF427 domain-containing protein [Woeseiaceae bacterium]
MKNIPDTIRRAREQWRNRGDGRPAGAPVPGPGQESVWDYPRPPALRPSERRVRVEFAGVLVADSSRALKLCETASPPTYYLPPEDVRGDLLVPVRKRTLCEWKGQARYWSLVVGDRVAEAAVWAYPDAWGGFEPVAGWYAFMPGSMDACYVGEDRVTAQAGSFYGGWITPDIVGPFKGEPDTGHW